MSKHAAWSHSLWNDMEEDDDSDTDSRLSGSVAVDSVMRRMQQKHSYVPPGEGGDTRGNEFTLDPDSVREDTDGGGASQSTTGSSSTQGGYRSSNGYRTGVSPSQTKRGGVGMMGLSPKSNSRSMGYVNVRLGSTGNYPGRRIDYLLSPVPENMSGRQVPNSSASDVGVVMGNTRGWMGSGHLGNGPLHRSMEMMHQGGRNSPGLMGRVQEDGRGDGYRSPHSHSSGSSEGISQHSISEHNRLPPSGATVLRRSTIGPSPTSTPHPPYHPPNIGPGRSPQLPSRFHHHHDNNMAFRNPHNDVLEHHVSGMGHAPSTTGTREPNLNDVIDYLSSPNPSNVANAAAYLQHLAYGDDSMKAKIRQYGGIPALISQLRSHDSVQAQLAILGALRNLSYGRANVENKLQIAGDAGLPELSLVLKSARHPEVKELVTSILWNLSSCDDIKFRILQICLKDLVEKILIPHSGYNYASLAVKDFSVRPNVTQWSPEMRNTLGALRNISSSGEDTRRFLRTCPHLVDALMWIVRAATGQEDTDEKTAENAMCILRNLSYRLEYEVDPLEGAQDHLDEEWERQVLAEIDDNRREEGEEQPRGRSKSFLSMCTRPRTADNTRRSVPRLATPQNLVCPDKSMIPKRIHAVTGVSLLWQPEVMFPYLALLEKFTSTPELMEAAAGAIQNLTACAWKWSVYVRYLVRKSNGLTLLIELLNHSHDTVVRSAATALRNLAVDYPNKRIIGLYGIQNIIPRLPYGQNNLGIAEQTNVALLCALMELTLNNSENARVFREHSGISQLVKLTRSKDHTSRIIYAAQKLCSILYEIKITKSSLKQEGWDIREYQHLSTENDNQFEFERAGFSNTELRRSGRGNGSGGGKEKKGRKKSNDENIAPIERRGSQPTLGLPPTPQGNNGAPQIRSVIQPDPIEPSYQTVNVSKQHLTNQNRPPISIQPIGMYAEIGMDAQQQHRPSEPLPSRPDSRSQSDSQTRSEPRSSPVDHNTQDGSEDESAAGLAVYAQVDMEKKRASRKQKQQQDLYREEVFIGGQQRPHPPQSQPEDSWV